MSIFTRNVTAAAGDRHGLPEDEILNSRSSFGCRFRSLCSGCWWGISFLAASSKCERQTSHHSGDNLLHDVVVLSSGLHCTAYGSCEETLNSQEALFLGILPAFRQIRSPWGDEKFIYSLAYSVFLQA